MKMFFLSAFALFLITLTTPSRSQTYDPSKIIPPTPTTAALGAYGDIPVGYSSGKPNISIPLFNIRSHDNALNVTLNYDASGTKVAQDASWVGLGWSLMTGGVITKSTRGYDDFKDIGGYYFSPTLPSGIDQSTFFDVDNGRLDLEPDLYSYNFGAYSGRFVLGKNADGSKVFIDDRNNLKIENNSGNWIITDPNGYKYNFTVTESSANYGYSSSGGEVPITKDLTPFSFQQTIATTGWYLTSIVSPKNDVITFNYIHRQSLSLINRTETQYDRNNQLAACLFGPPYTQADEDFLTYYLFFNASRQKNSEVYLESITYSNGSVEFKTTDRKDIDFLDATQKPAKLSSIILFDKNHQIIKTFSFTHNYFKDATGTSTATDNLRLKLESVTEIPKTGTPKPPYQFFYNSDSELPTKYSKNIDHWGYYNGATNNRLLPMPSSLRPPNYVVFPYLNDANREPDITYTYAKAAVLSSIKYPTGGHTDFEYELNDYGHLQGDESYADQGDGYVVNASPWDHFDHTFVAFDIGPEDVDPRTHVCAGTVYSSYSYVENTPILSGVQTDYGSFSGATAAATFRNDLQRDPMGTGQGIQTPTIPVNLGIGHYTLSVRYIQGYSVSAHVSFTKKVRVTEKKGGGLRIKTIAIYDMGNQIARVKKYLYTNDDGSSSGRLLAPVIYGYQCPPIQFTNMPNCNPSSMYTCRMSGTVYPAGLSAKGGVIGYNKVTELEGSNGEGGKTEYYYSNSEGSYSPFPGMPITEDMFNGKLTKQIVYNAVGQELKRTENVYTLKDTKYIRGAVIYKGPPVPTTLTYPQIGTDPGFTISNGSPYAVNYYNNNSNWVVLDSTAEVDDFYKGSLVTPVTTIHHYYYDNPAHLQLTRQITSKSDGKTKTSVTNYADDYPLGTGFIDDMKTAHITGVPIEEVTYLGNGNTAPVISGQVTKFKTGGKGLVDQVLKLESLPIKTLATFKFSNSLLGQLPSPTQSAYLPDSKYQPKITVNQYDDAGNAVCVTPENGSPIVFIWSYNKQYPVAKIQNGNYESIVSALGGTIAVNDFANSYPTETALNTFLNPLRNDPALTGTQMTTYTYDPSAGMTSSTDPKGITTYYEYDDLQRLKNIKDKDKNIIKNFSYQYASQQPVSPPVSSYGNVPKSATFLRNNCGSGYAGGSVTYIVQAGSFTASSQSAADQLAQDYANANGQSYANLNGTCTIIPAPVTPFVTMNATQSYLGADNHYYEVYTFRTYSDAAYTVPYSVPSNYAIQYRVIERTTVNGGTPTTNTSIRTATIMTGTNSKSVTIDVNTCGSATPPTIMASKSATEQQQTTVTPNLLPPGGGTTCTTATVMLLAPLVEL